MADMNKEFNTDHKATPSEPVPEALDLIHEVEAEHIDTSKNNALRWKIDLRLMPLLCITYALQSIDKTTLGYAAVFNLSTELDLHGTQYSWISAIFYLGYLVWEYPTNVLLQKLPINYFMSATVSFFYHWLRSRRMLIRLGHLMGHRPNVPCKC